MAEKTINEEKIVSSAEDTKLKTEEMVSHAKPIDGQSFIEIDVNKIKNNPLQPRFHIDESEIQELMSSIKLHGLVQPIAVIKSGENYILKAGQRRWLAHKKLGLKTIKAIVQEESLLPEKEIDKSLFEIAVIENTQRENLDPLEIALSLQKAMDKRLYKNQDELSVAIGKSKSYVSKVLKVLSLEKEITNDLKENRSTNDLEALYEMQRIKNSNEQKRIYFEFIDKKIDRKYIRDYNRHKDDSLKTEPPFKFINRAKAVKLEFDTTELTDEQISDMKQDLEKVLQKYFN